MSGPFLISYGALWFLVAFQTLVLIGLVRRVYRLQGVESSLSRFRGQPLPSFTATDLNGRAVDSAKFAGRPRAILFVSPDCSSCTLTLAELQALKWKADDNLIVVCRSSTNACRELAREHSLAGPVIADEDLALSHLFEVTAVPTAILVNEEDHIYSYGHPEREELAEVLETEGESATALEEVMR